MSSTHSTSTENSLGADERRALRKLVQGIVLAQGNEFIKELLRSKGIKIGSTKADFESNMLEAIRNGQLRRSDVDQWLDEVEGWGNQHVYLHHVPQSMVNDARWWSSGSVLERVRAAGYANLWQAQTSLRFPRKRELSGIYFDGDSFRMVWQQGLGSLVRKSDQDREEEIEGDRYQFRAYLHRADRTVMRFDMRRRAALAAIFVQTPWTQEAHREALAEVEQSVTPLVDFSTLTRFSTSDAIKRLDQAELADMGRRTSPITTQVTRLSDAGVYVEFANTTAGNTYKDSEPIRHVRQAVQTERFIGTTGLFSLPVSGRPGGHAKVKVELYGESSRIRLWAQMTAQQVWEVLTFLGGHG